MKRSYSNSFFMLFLIAIIVLPMAQSQMIAPNSEVEKEIQMVRESNPFADPVAPMSPEIQYSGAPVNAYSPEPQEAPTGPQTLIVLLVYFSDLSYSESSSTINSIIFGNVDDYYQEISFGQCSISGAVAGWYNIGNTKAYYGADGATSGATDDFDDDGDNDSWRLVDDAISVADPFVDFSLYGHIMVVHAGNGQESSGVSTDIWSVRWSWPGHFVTDEKTFDSSSIVPETQGGDVDRCVGVIAHEFGHDIGLPDLYHYGHVGEDDFVDEWGLMASGSWNGVPSGYSPAHPMAYCKIQLEWITDIVEFSYDSHITRVLDNQETLVAFDQVIKVIMSPTQYYLVEVRSNYGNDQYLPSTGVIITYCDESIASGQGIVKVQDAHPGTTTLDDAAYQAGESFLDGELHIDILDVEVSGSWAYISVMWKDEGWIDDFGIANTGENQYNPDITSDSSGNLYMAYEEYYSAWGTQVIRLRMSSDDGRTWTYLAGFGSTINNCYNPKIVVDSQFYNTVYVVYEEEISPTNYNIMGYAYNSTGSHFMYIDTDSDNDRYPCITCEFGFGDSNRVYVAYEELFTYDDRDMIVKQSVDKGENWSTVLELGAILDYNVYCDLSITYTVDSSSYAHLYVAYVYGADYTTGYSVGVYHSTNRGTSWMHSWAVSAASQEKHYTSIAAGHTTGTVVIAWHHAYSSTDKDVWVAYSTDNGVTWASQWIAISTLNETDVDVSVDGQGESDWTIECPYFHIVYRLGNDVVYKRAAANRPHSWSSAEVVNSGGSASLSYKRPAVTGTIREDGSHHPSIAWTEFQTPYAIYYTTRGGDVTFLTEPAGLVLIVDGLQYTTPIVFEWIAGTLIDFEAPLIQSGAPGIRYVWSDWTGGLISPSYRTHPDLHWACDPYDVVLTAHYDTEYYLTVNSDYGTTSGEGWYSPGSMAYVGLDISIMAGTVGQRFVFQTWTDDASGTTYSQSDAILMNGPKTATAEWDTEYYLTVTSTYSTHSGEGWYSSGTIAFAGLDAYIVAGVIGERFVFESWTDDASGTDYAQSEAITMDGAKTATATWETEYYLTVATVHGTPSGEGWYSSGSTAYAGLDADIVAGTTGERFVFESWTDDASGTDYAQSEAITMDGAKTATASWDTEYYLTVTTAHGTPSGEGWYSSGSTAYAGLDAGLIPGGTGERFLFLSWIGDGSGTNYATSDPISMDAPKEISTNWQTEYYLTISTPYGTPSGEGWYADSTLAYASLNTGLVSGTPGVQYVFDSWSDDATGSDYAWSDSITMDGPKTATAVWNTEYYLTVSSSEATTSGEGWYVAETIAYAGLDVGSVPVTSGERIAFQSWTGDSTGSDYAQSDAITMDSPKTATAVWQTQYQLTCTTNPSGLSPLPTITPDGEWFDDGDIIIASAGEIAGYNFTHWIVDGISSAEGVTSITLVMDEAHNAVAYYQASETTTTTTTTGTSPPLDGTMLLVLMGAGGAVVAIVILVVVMKKKT